MLLIEDSAPYAALVEQMLIGGLEQSIVLVRREEIRAARRALSRERFDCVLLDLSLPDARGLEALHSVQSIAPEVPIVVLTGLDDETLALQAVTEGAQDFISKRSADGELLARSVRYVIERKRAEGRLAHQALHDPLTGLPNRMLLLDRVHVALARARRQPSSVALLFLDLDRFKIVNDSLGHHAGDELLLEVAARLRRVLRPGDTVARFGGDEFLILCEDLASELEAVRVAERARTAVGEPLVLRGHAISLHVSVGIAWAGGAGAAAQKLIGEADAAMYRAKRKGSGVELFEPGMHAEAMTHLEIEHQLPAAVTEGQLRVYYQPEILLAEGGRPFGVEALVRWQHPERGLLMPAQFIGVAEETGAIIAIGEWVLSEACRQLAALRREGRVPERFMVSVNLSLRQLSSPRLAEAVANSLAESGLPPELLCLEVTESSVARDGEGAAGVLRELKALGVTLALDDFGTGYSSLSALSTYPLDVVKIDRSFIVDAATDVAASRIFGAVLGVVRAAELQAVAEGIESDDQLRLLKQMGCEGAQGFLFSRPMPWEELLESGLAGARGPALIE